jgi:hypothetical protein
MDSRAAQRPDAAVHFQKHILPDVIRRRVDHRRTEESAEAVGGIVPERLEVHRGAGEVFTNRRTFPDGSPRRNTRRPCRARRE